MLYLAIGRKLGVPHVLLMGLVMEGIARVYAHVLVKECEENEYRLSESDRPACCPGRKLVVDQSSEAVQIAASQSQGDPTPSRNARAKENYATSR